MAATEQSAPKTPPAEKAMGEGGASGLRLRQVASFAEPVYLTAPRGDRRRLFVVEQGGTIRVVKDGRKLRRPYLDISEDVQAGGEQGLLSMAFAPDYARSRRFYVYFTGTDGDIRIREYRGSGDRANRGSARDLLRIEHSQHGNHNGGQLQFGPDGLLYIGTGDGGGGGDPFEAGQDLGQQLGKLLRIDPRGRPFKTPGNPFKNRSGARNTVYSYGLRNPWRFSFDRKTGDLVIADVGQDAVEEVDFVRKGGGRGANFGWNTFEGSRRFDDEGDAPGHVKPVIELSHDSGACSITGGYVLRHRSYGALRGTYVYADLCEGILRGARLALGRASDRRTFGRIETPSSFGQDSRGRVYAVSLSGPVYRLVPR